MTEPPIGPETLNAYVDRELPPAAAARIARRAAREPGLAAQIATLQELRAGVAAIAPETVPLRPERSPGRLWGARAGLAAALAALTITLAAGLWQAGPERAAPADTAPLARLVAEYDAWHDTRPARALPRDIASPRMTALMEATGLALVHEDRIALADGTELRHSGFLGERDCRISLFEMPRTASGFDQPALALHGPASLMQASWTSARTRHILIARDMDKVRFATIADTLREATRSFDGDDAALIARLDAARQRCVG